MNIRLSALCLFIKASCCLRNASLRRFVPLVFFPAEIEAEYHETT